MNCAVIGRSARAAAKGIAARVVSVPAFELFEEQSAEYQASVIGTAKVKIAVEAGVRQGWDRFIGNDGGFVGMKSFGASAPGGTSMMLLASAARRSAPMVSALPLMR